MPGTPNMKTLRSAPTTLSWKMNAAKGGFAVAALGVAAFALSWLGAPGTVGSYAVERTRNGLIASRQKEVLAKHLGLSSAEELDAKARSDPRYKAVVDPINNEKANANRSTTFANGGALALGAWMPGLSGVSHLVAHGGVALGGAVTSSLFDRHSFAPHEVMQDINAKRASGKAVAAQDILLLKIAQNQNWQAQFKKQHGYTFDKAKPELRRQVVNAMPELGWAQGVANQFNSGTLEEPDLLMLQLPAPAQNWAQAVGGSRKVAGSFVQHVQAGRAASGQQVAGPTLG